MSGKKGFLRPISVLVAALVASVGQTKAVAGVQEEPKIDEGQSVEAREGLPIPPPATLSSSQDGELKLPRHGSHSSHSSHASHASHTSHMSGFFPQ